MARFLKVLMWLGGLVTAEALGKQAREMRPAAVRSAPRPRQQRQARRL